MKTRITFPLTDTHGLAEFHTSAKPVFENYKSSKQNTADK